MLDADLADLYSVDTGQLNRAIKRNVDRFPEDFMFQLSDQEFTDLKCQTGISRSWGGRRTTPFAFTEQGVAMLSSVLRSKEAAHSSENYQLDLLREAVPSFTIPYHTNYFLCPFSYKQRNSVSCGERIKIGRIKVERTFSPVEFRRIWPSEPIRKVIFYMIDQNTRRQSVEMMKLQISTPIFNWHIMFSLTGFEP